MKKVAQVLMDLSKTFDSINHVLLIEKLHAYGFSEEANRKVRVKINNTFRSWTELIQIVPQGLVIGLYFLTFI